MVNAKTGKEFMVKSLLLLPCSQLLSFLPQRQPCYRFLVNLSREILQIYVQIPLQIHF